MVFEPLLRYNPHCITFTGRSNTIAMRITAKGQVTIPQTIREQLGLLPETEVEFIVEGSTVRLVKAESVKGESRGQRMLRHLRGRASVSMSTDEIMAFTRDDP